MINKDEINKDDMKNKLLELYEDAVLHGRPSLRQATKKEQLKIYPIMQLIKELCFIYNSFYNI